LRLGFGLRLGQGGGKGLGLCLRLPRGCASASRRNGLGLRGGGFCGRGGASAAGKRLRLLPARLGSCGFRFGRGGCRCLRLRPAAASASAASAGSACAWASARHWRPRPGRTVEAVLADREELRAV
jgi:hypothetical protein